MKYDGILIGVDEIWIKSERVKNKLMKMLANQIEKRLDIRTRIGRGRVYIDEYREEWLGILNKIFGIRIYAPFIKVKTDLEEIKRASEYFFKDFKGSFKIVTKRAWKGFDKTSLDVNREVGEYIVNKFGLKVDVKNPEKILYIEIHRKYTYLYDKKYEGPGGFPLGAQGKGLALLSGGIDSPVAAYLMGKRGLDLDFLFINMGGPSYENAVYTVYKKLQEYFPESKLYVLDLDLSMLLKVKEGYRQILFKVLLYKIAEAFAELKGYKVLVTGESLGQVSTQTLESLVLLDSLVDITILRPLIGFNKEETIRIAKAIGTYDLSSKVPELCQLEKHPTTRPKRETVLEEWNKLNVNLVNLISKIRPAKPTSEDILDYIPPKGEKLIVVDVKDYNKVKFEKDKKYLLICPRGSSALALARELRRKGIMAYALDYKTARKMGFIK